MKTTSILRQYAFAMLASLGLAACTSEEQCHINGNITDAKDSVLYFEHIGIKQILVLDSVKLDENGSFSFSDKRHDSPEFYRLRIAGQIINVSVDSTETISIKAKHGNMASGYEVTGSESSKKIKELSLMQMDLQKAAIAIYDNKKLDNEAVYDSISKLVVAYKNGVKANYIYTNPKDASSYFALFQTLGNIPIFNPQPNSEDIKTFAAVATSWDTFYPNATRTQNLHNIAIEGMKAERTAAAKQNAAIDADKIVETNIIDIALNDNKGDERKLSDLKGKVVLLDFHVFATKESPARILTMRELYNKYHSRGLEIYQVAFDTDEHFWKVQTENLPWISVRDVNGPNSYLIRSYNLFALPEFFIIDRNNSLVCRSQQIDDLEKTIEKLL